MRVSVFPHFCQHVLLLVSFIIVGAVGTVGAKLYITVILICIFLMTNYAKLVFTYFHVLIGHLYIPGEIVTQMCSPFLSG